MENRSLKPWAILTQKTPLYLAYQSRQTLFSSQPTMPPHRPRTRTRYSFLRTIVIEHDLNVSTKVSWSNHLPITSSATRLNISFHAKKKCLCDNHSNHLTAERQSTICHKTPSDDYANNLSYNPEAEIIR